MTELVEFQKPVAFRPLYDCILVKPKEANDMTKGGIYIPETAQRKTHQGTVLAVGPGKIAMDGARYAPDVEVGDTVLYSKYAGSEVNIDNEDYIVLRCSHEGSEVLGVL